MFVASIADVGIERCLFGVARLIQKYWHLGGATPGCGTVERAGKTVDQDAPSIDFKTASAPTMQDGSFLPKNRLHKTSYTLHGLRHLLKVLDFTV